MTAPRKFYGWGLEGQGISQEQEATLERSLAERYQSEVRRHSADPKIEDFDLPAPRVTPPSSLAPLFESDPRDRLVHTYGKSFPDTLRMLRREVPHPPDLVAYPRDEDDVEKVLSWASDEGIAVIPFGGGSSVVGGVECDVGDDYAGCISLDLARLDRVLEIDHASRCARIQAGVRGPHLEAQLKEHGYSLRHFPQSFEHSTLGGWIATRSGGHFATLYTHIDDFVESTRSVTPRGILATRRLPGSGAGPSPDRMMIGSEGVLGVITEAWMRIQDRPTFRSSASVSFRSYEKATEAVRALSQSALFPSNCRLIDAAEAESSGAGDGESSLLVLAFESADHATEPWLHRALELAQDHGGAWSDPWDAESAHRSGAAGAWREAFINAPYFREVLVPRAILSDTFETSITWDRFVDFHARIKDRLHAVLREVTGRDGSVTCRFTHVYPDGPAPYFTFQVLGDWDRLLEQWRDIKLAANEIVTQLGGTVTHHHAVGRDHRPRGYDQQRPPLFAEALIASKAALDPSGILNPGVLVDPEGCDNLTGGTLGESRGR